MPGANLDTQDHTVESDQSVTEKPASRRKTRRSKKSEAQHAQSQDQKKSRSQSEVSSGNDEVSSDLSDLPPEPEEFQADTEQDSSQTPSIEVITEDGDIQMMTPSEYETYQAEQQDESNK
jgi:hypothetical protein